MRITINGYDISKLIIGYTVDKSCRGKSVVYTIDGTAKVDRIGDFKSNYRLTFGLLSISQWEQILTEIKKSAITLTEDGSEYNVHLTNDPSAETVYQDVTGRYVSNITVELEEI